ncbi:SDR family oxidoreductase [Dyella choica]|uniref:SDR family oxidoreductase n=1 Tax=Dyella choica TaxID=1927959 RepID=UPI003CCDDECD
MRPGTEAKAFVASAVPGGAGTSAEVANVVAFLASDHASFVSGHGLLVGDGYSIA